MMVSTEFASATGASMNRGVRFTGRTSTHNRRGRVVSGVISGAVVLLCLFLTGCAHGNGYGLDSARTEDAIQRQDAAQKAPAADSRDVYLSLIQRMQSQGMYFASLAHIDAFEKKFGSAPDIRLLRADALEQTGQSANARSVYATLLDTSAAAQAYHGIGLIDAEQGNYSNALLSLSHAVEQDPTNPMYLNDLGFADLKSGHIAAARLPIAQAAELAPTSHKVIGNLVLFLLLTGDSTRANQVMDRSELPLSARDAIGKLAAQISRDNGAAVERADVALPQRPVSLPVEKKSDARVTVLGAQASPNSVLETKSNPISADEASSSYAQGPVPLQSMLDRFGQSP